MISFNLIHIEPFEHVLTDRTPKFNGFFQVQRIGILSVVGFTNLASILAFISMKASSCTCM